MHKQTYTHSTDGWRPASAARKHTGAIPSVLQWKHNIKEFGEGLGKGLEKVMQWSQSEPYI